MNSTAHSAWNRKWGAIVGFAQHETSMAYDYKGRPRMLSSQRGMVAADQGDCSAMGRQPVPCLHLLLVLAPFVGCCYGST